MKRIQFFFILFICIMTFVLVHPSVIAQGCSDAGICTVKSFRPEVSTQGSSSYNHEIRFGLYGGAADHNILVLGDHLSYAGQFTDRLRLEGKVTFLSQNGNDISVLDAGDVFLDMNYGFTEKLSATGGIKIPLTKANRRHEGLPLPMDYQSSLGTLDLFAGLNYTAGKWQWTIGYQYPLEQNENAFFPELYPIGSPLRTFQATNQFERSADLLARISYLKEFNEKSGIGASLLPIYHLGEDNYTDMDGNVQSIQGSDGLTLNANFYYLIHFDDKNLLEFSIGFPLIVREARPDGLTRSFVFGVDYGFSF